jgi:hypothetical protein
MIAAGKEELLRLDTELTMLLDNAGGLGGYGFSIG